MELLFVRKIVTFVTKKIKLVDFPFYLRSMAVSRSLHFISISEAVKNKSHFNCVPGAVMSLFCSIVLGIHFGAYNRLNSILWLLHKILLSAVQLVKLQV